MEIPIIRMNNGWLLIMVTHQGGKKHVYTSVRFSVDIVLQICAILV